jgi:excisionase family DNA binding protein
MTTMQRRFDELPELLTPQDLINYLPVGRDSVYHALKTGTIQNVRIGQKFIVTKAALRDFLGGSVE